MTDLQEGGLVLSFFFVFFCNLFCDFLRLCAKPFWYMHKPLWFWYNDRNTPSSAVPCHHTMQPLGILAQTIQAWILSSLFCGSNNRTYKLRFWLYSVHHQITTKIHKNMKSNFLKKKKKKRISVGHNELSLCSVKSRLFIYCFPSPDHILGSTFLLSNISSGTMNNRMAMSNLRYAFQMN